jgi:hypothetical protein
MPSYAEIETAQSITAQRVSSTLQKNKTPGSCNDIIDQNIKNNTNLGNLLFPISFPKPGQALLRGC